MMMGSARERIEGINAAGTHVSKCRLQLAAAEGSYGTFMGQQSAIVRAAIEGGMRAVSKLLETQQFPLQELNYAIFEASIRGNTYILRQLIDAGATDLDAAMEAAGWSGHIHIIQHLMASGNSVSIGRAFLGAMLSCRMEVIEFLVGLADPEGLEQGFRIGAGLIWSRSDEQVECLARAMDHFIKAGVNNFEEALRCSCSPTAILHLNGSLMAEKAKIFYTIITKASKISRDFYNSLLLQSCVCFLYRMSILEAGDAALVDHKNIPSDVSVFVCEFVPFLPKVKRMQHVLDSARATEDMMSVFSVLFWSGVGFIDDRLARLSDFTVQKARVLLGIKPNYECRSEWPLKMMRFLITKCGCTSENAIGLSVETSTNLGVMLPVLELLVECKCLFTVDLYQVLALAAAYRQTAAIRYLLNIIPKPVLVRPMMEVFKIAASENIGPEGVLYLLHSNFLDDPTATLRAAAMAAASDETTQALKQRLTSEWSQEAYREGVEEGVRHRLNLINAIKYGRSGLCLRDLPWELQVAICYLPLYKECRRTPGSILSEKQRGELVEAVRYLYRWNPKVTESVVIKADKDRLLTMMAACLPDWA